MKWLAAVCVTLICAMGFAGCVEQRDLKQGDYAMRYFFSASVLEVQEEALVLEVFDKGNTSLTEGARVEVSTDVVSADGCPAFVIGEYARVLMEDRVDDQHHGRLEAYAISKTDETGMVVAD